MDPCAIRTAIALKAAHRIATQAGPISTQVGCRLISPSHTRTFSIAWTLRLWIGGAVFVHEAAVGVGALHVDVGANGDVGRAARADFEIDRSVVRFVDHVMAIARTFWKGRAIAGAQHYLATIFDQREFAKPEYLELFVDTCKALGPEYPDAVPFGLINGEPDNNTLKDTFSPKVVSGTVKEAANEVIVTSLGGGLGTKCAEAENNGCGEVALLTKPKSGTGMWALKVLHEFSGPDGAGPYGSLLNVGQKLYGVTEGDGDPYACATSPTLGGCGTIFALTKGSVGWSWGGTIYKFKSGTDGAAPLGQLTLYKGQIFGVTAAGGKNTHCTTCGTIFLLTP
jgi:hypothetical protein